MKVLVAVLGLGAAAAVAHAAPLNLVRPTAPNLTDVNGATPAITYQSATGNFRIRGASAQVIITGNASATSITPVDGTWVIDANVSNTGVVNFASLTISGAYPGPGSSTLLTSTLVQSFGFQFSPTNGLQLEFLFNGMAGGTLNPSNQQIGVIIADSSILATSFSADFTNDPFGFGFGANSTGDAFLIPAPGAGMILGAGMFAMARRRRR